MQFIEQLKQRLLDENNIGEYRSLPFWSWNDELKSDKLINQIKWMKEQGFGGYFMHARGGLTTEYLSDEWFEAIEDCVDAGTKLGMQNWAYDENGWPSGFVGGKLLEDIDNRDEMLKYTIGDYDGNAYVSYRITENKLIRVSDGNEQGEYLNIYRTKSNSTADVINPDVVDKFIALTHEEYKNRLGEKFENLKGFFTDEPQYYRWAHPYSRTLPKAFKEKYGEDILDNLGLLFVKKEGYESFRYKYWRLMQELLLNSFAKKIYEWCDKNGVELTGHYIEEVSLYWQVLCCGGIMPFYEYEHIPGIDNLGRSVPRSLVPRQVSSVACQVGRKKVMTETFACCGWDVTPTTLKTVAEGQYVHGINLMCEHLVPYSESGQRKRDYPAHFSAVNPWVKKDFKSFNDYFAKLGYLLAESKESVSVAVFNPLRSVYFDYQRYDFDAKNKVNSSYIEVTNKLASMNIGYHIIDETLLAKYGKNDNGRLVLGNCVYDYVIFPEIITMDRTSKNILDEYYSCGGKMLFVGSKPTYVEGDKCDYAYDSNVTMEEIVNSQPYTVSDYNTKIHSCMREYNGKKFIYAVNIDFNNDYTITFNGNFNCFIKLDLETMQTKKVSNTLKLRVGESAILFVEQDDNFNVEQTALKEVSLDGKFKVFDCQDNFMLLDKLYYSLDGVNYSEKIRYMGVFNELLNKRYSGKVYLKYEFECQAIPKSIKFMSEDMHILAFEVNGVKVEFTERSDVEEKLLIADIAKFVKKGVNQAIITIDFYESEQVYYVLFGENIDESLKNCLVYDTTIEACYLKGDFGVYSHGAFEKGKEKNVYLADNFYVGERNTEIENGVAQGYPFFAGEMTVEKQFELQDANVLLKLDGNYCIAYDIEINGQKVDKTYFVNVIDISKFAKIGQNTIKLTFIVSNRNLLGPHHYKYEEEPFGVGPGTFELTNSWTNGKSCDERDNYSFVRFGLF